MIPTSVHLAPRCGLGTKVPRPMANLGGQESLVVLLERKDGPEKLAGQCTGQYLRNPRMGGPFRVATYETQDHRPFCDDRPYAGLVQAGSRSEEHTSELQSQSNLVCRLLLEKKKLVYAITQI